MYQKHPGSTLFPYTTLFRSGRARFARGHRHQVFGQVRRNRRVGSQEEGSELAVGHSRLHEDRKSTRLNSSHVESSYAVFCLKKKKLSLQDIVDSIDGVVAYM